MKSLLTFKQFTSKLEMCKAVLTSSNLIYFNVFLFHSFLVADISDIEKCCDLRMHCMRCDLLLLDKLIVCINNHEKAGNDVNYSGHGKHATLVLDLVSYEFSEWFFFFSSKTHVSIS